MEKYYVDSCIYLNLWQNEKSRLKIFANIARDFFYMISQ